MVALTLRPTVCDLQERGTVVWEVDVIVEEDEVRLCLFVCLWLGVEVGLK